MENIYIIYAVRAHHAMNKNLCFALLKYQLIHL